MVSRRVYDQRKSRTLSRANARRMRHAMTEAELHFWVVVRNRQIENYKFRRQVPIGPYIADFLCVERKLIVELDGSQHAVSTYDLRRDAYLKSLGYRVLRFWNYDVLQNMDGVVRHVLEMLRQK